MKTQPWSFGHLLIDASEATTSSQGVSPPGDGALFPRGLGWSIPSLPDGSQPYRDGMTLLRNVPRRVDALNVWLGAVSGLEFGGDADAARAAGAEGQPDWNFKAAHPGEQGEAVGNVMFSFTGYMLGMDVLEQAGVPPDVASALVEVTLKLGGGAFQVFNDLRKGRFQKVDRNWYGEEEKDVKDVQAGIEFAKFTRLEEKFSRYGVKLNAKDFGFRTRELEAQHGSHVLPSLGTAVELEQLAAQIERDAAARAAETIKKRERQQKIEEEARLEREWRSKTKPLDLRLP